MTTNNEHPNRNNQIRPFVLTSHTEDEDGLTLNIRTCSLSICPALSWVGTTLFMDENYGEEHIYTTLVVNP